MREMAKLGDVLNVRRGTTITKKDTVEGDVPVIGGGTEPTYYHNKPNREGGCITISGSGASAGYVNMWSMPIHASDCSTVEPKDKKHLKSFIFYYLKAQQDFIFKNFRSGAAQPHVYAKDIARLDYPILSLPEQKAIVDKLDKAFAEIDSIRKKLEKKFSYLDLFLDSILNLTSLTSESKKIKLQEVCQIKAKLVSPKDKPYLNEPHIGAGNIISLSNQLIDVLTAKEEKLISGKFPFDTDSVLYSKIRPYLRKVHLPEYSGICSADIYPLVADEKKIIREYLYFLLLSKNFTTYAISTSARAGMPKVNRESLFNFEFFLPALESQKRIVEKIKNIFSNFSKIKQINESKIGQLENLKSTILKKNFKVRLHERS